MSPQTPKKMAGETKTTEAACASDVKLDCSFSKQTNRSAYAIPDTSSLPNCPPDVIFRAQVSYENGFGFQGPLGGDSQEYYLCIINGILNEDAEARKYSRWSKGEPDVDDMDALRLASGSKTLRLGDFIGKVFLAIHWTEHELIPAVLTKFVELGFNFQLQIKTLPGYGPTYGDTEFTLELLEKALERNARNIIAINYLRYMVLHPHENHGFENYFDPWNWKTVKGKDFCKWLRTQAKLDPIEDETTHKDNYFMWKKWTNYEEAELEQPEKKRKVQTES